MNLFIFNHILDNPIITSLSEFKKTESEAAYYRALQGLIRYAPHRLTDKNIILEYVLRRMLESEALPNILNLRNFLRNDIKNIYHVFFETDWDALAHSNELAAPEDITLPPHDNVPRSYAMSIASMTACTSNEALGGAILAHVESFGTGVAAAYPALEWDGSSLRGFGTKPRPGQTFNNDFRGHAKIIAENTAKHLHGENAENILLFGKNASAMLSCVYDCLDMYSESGLRMIFVDRSAASSVADIFEELDTHTLRYIVVLDCTSGTGNIPAWFFDRNTNQPLVYAICRQNDIDLPNFGILLDFE